MGRRLVRCQGWLCQIAVAFGFILSSLDTRVADIIGFVMLLHESAQVGVGAGGIVAIGHLWDGAAEEVWLVYRKFILRVTVQSV